MVKVHEAGYGPNLRLPVHDELVVSLPMESAETQACHIGELMAERMGSVHINTDPAVTGKSWGHEYMLPDVDLQKQADQEITAAGLW